MAHACQETHLVVLVVGLVHPFDSAGEVLVFCLLFCGFVSPSRPDRFSMLEPFLPDQRLEKAPHGGVGAIHVALYATVPSLHVVLCPHAIL